MNYPLVKLKYYFSLFRDISSFIKSPKPVKDLQKTTKEKIYDTIGLYVLKIVFLIPVVLFFAVIYDPENVQGPKMSERFSTIGLILVGGFILPLVEEIAFRLSLLFRPIYLALSAGVFTYYFMTKLVFRTKISLIDENFVTRIVISLAVGALLFTLANHKKIKPTISQFWERNFRIIYYLSCIVFAWIHISKYETIWLNIVLLPILTLPQLMSALVNGYTRVTFGFQYPLLFHFTNNLIGIGFTLLPLGDMIN